ncbi:uncharacterized protein [Prorops nasuta]|uniref:uncharacterized protein n=1 Tax=Prorops nasuta TaxID=863751 RepID=UPI0034CFE702
MKLTMEASNIEKDKDIVIDSSSTNYNQYRSMSSTKYNMYVCTLPLASFWNVSFVTVTVHFTLHTMYYITRKNVLEHLEQPLRIGTNIGTVGTVGTSISSM